MSALGKIVLKPRGDYSASATYLQLDWVRYNGGVWVCKQECSGITPVEGNYWSLMIELDSIIDDSQTSGVTTWSSEKIDELLDDKADTNDVYTKTETDDLLDDKADADSIPTFTYSNGVLNITTQ